MTMLSIAPIAASELLWGMNCRCMTISSSLIWMSPSYLDEKPPARFSSCIASFGLLQRCTALRIKKREEKCSLPSRAASMRLWKDAYCLKDDHVHAMIS